MEKIGIILGRFQVSDLHSGHRHYIDSVLEKHKHVIVLLSVSGTINTEEDPLDYEQRKAMLDYYFAFRKNAITILPIYNIYGELGNKLWSEQLDSLVNLVYPNCEAVLYGSRKSSLDAYLGKFEKCYVDPKQYVNISGTEERRKIFNSPIYSEEFRAGVIYAAYQSYPTTYPTVDVLIFNKENVILGRKLADARYRFVGGFIDPTDETVESAVRREVKEEVGIEIEGLKYLGSSKIEDSRYLNANKRGVMSLFYSAQYVFGCIKANDDLSEVKEFNFEELKKNYKNILIPQHQNLFENAYIL